ncbi:MAG TPA: thioredoxin family protein [Thermoanaerobaculia bacterium]|jgi:thiol-disulfide isomerase/thioredoxin|nr:thioredoxin family protein [Thermoanaerobaculia bacterium]
MMPPRALRSGFLTLALGAAFASGPIGAAAGQMGADAFLHGFERSGDYQLTVGGKVQPAAEIYALPSGVPAFLILSSALPSPVLLMPGEGSVQTVQLMKILTRPDGTVDLMADAALSPQGKFEIVGEDVRFKTEGRTAALQPRPALLGLKKAVDLTTYNPEYARRAKAYKPNDKAVQKLRGVAQPVRVRVFFGSWCPHCKEHVPLLLKVEEQIKGSKIQIEYYGLAKGLGDADSKKFGIQSVPTGVVYSNGKEIGRLNAADWAAPETALAALLARK